MIRRSGLTLVALSALAACTPAIVPQPGARPAPPPPVPAPPSVALGPDWQDWPVAQGNWTYAREQGATVARFGAGAAVTAWARCDLASRTVAVGRSVAHAGGMMMVRTSFGVLQWPTRPATHGVEAARGASDPGLDQIAFSRGRFTVELPGNPPLVLPTWAEPTRVIEDCRG
ncbi:MAG TPA: hypothetical protein VF475_01340 [Sphingobium sp.]